MKIILLHLPRAHVLRTFTSAIENIPKVIPLVLKMKVLLLMFLSCALTKVSFSDDHSFTVNLGSLVSKPMNNGPKNIPRLHELTNKKEIPMSSMHKYGSHKLKSEQNQSHAPQTLSRQVRQRRQNSDNQQTCLPPQHATVWNSSESAQATESKRVSLNIFPKSSFKLRVALYVCCDTYNKLKDWYFSYCSSTLGIQEENVWHFLSIATETRKSRLEGKQWYVDVTSDNEKVTRGTRLYEPLSFSNFTVGFDSGDVTWYFGPPPKCTQKTTSTMSVPATEPSADVETVTESDTSTATEMANSTGTALNTATSSSLHLLWLLLVALLVVVIVAAVVVSKRRAKSQSPVQKPTSFRRESVNSMYGAAPEVRKTSINSLYGTDLSTDPSHVYANAAQHGAGHRAASGRNKAVVTGSTSWVDPDAGNAYYEASSPNYEPISPNIYHNQC